MDDPEFISTQPISKSQRKRDSHELQSVGVELLSLSVDQLKHFELPEELLTAVLEAKRIPVSKHTALKRQRQYIGRLMRDIDPAPIVEKLSAMKGTSAKQNAMMHLAEQWREKLIVEPGALEALIHDFPAAPGERILALVGKVRAEREAKRPPKHFRELYQLIHGLVQEKSKE
jgi:ribosome-associated protein